jgi:hypothetical protein
MNKNQRIVTTIAIIAIALLCLASIVATAFVLNNYLGLPQEVAEEPSSEESDIEEIDEPDFEESDVEEIDEPDVEEPSSEESDIEEIDVNETSEKVIVVPAAREACSYDYDIMPEGFDEEGIPLADYGLDLAGETIVGPAIVQLNSLTAIAVYPGEEYEVPDGTTTWMYTGDKGCPRGQYQYFPGKTIYRIDAVEIDEIVQ